MASLIDTYSSAVAGAPSTNDAEAQNQANVQTGRLSDIYTNRALPQLVDRYASRGTFQSGHETLAANQLNQDYQQQVSDVQANLMSIKNGLLQRRILATYGGNPETLVSSGAF